MNFAQINTGFDLTITCAADTGTKCLYFSSFILRQISEPICAILDIQKNCELETGFHWTIVHTCLEIIAMNLKRCRISGLVTGKNLTQIYEFGDLYSIWVLKREVVNFLESINGSRYSISPIAGNEIQILYFAAKYKNLYEYMDQILWYYQMSDEDIIHLNFDDVMLLSDLSKTFHVDKWLKKHPDIREKKHLEVLIGMIKDSRFDLLQLFDTILLYADKYPETIVREFARYGLRHVCEKDRRRDDLYKKFEKIIL